jgi:hypothetical protein
MNPYLEHPELWHQVQSVNGQYVSFDEIVGDDRSKIPVAIEQRAYMSVDDPLKFAGICRHCSQTDRDTIAHFP